MYTYLSSASQLFISTLIAAFTLSLSTLVVLTLLDNGAMRVVQSAVLRHQLRGLRMSRMLRQRHIDEQQYLNLTPIAEIRQQLKNCRQCSHQQQCDNAYVLRCAADLQFSYCPNTSALSASKAVIAFKARRA